VDGNQAQIVEALRAIEGCKVVVASAVGSGFPDLVVGYRGFNFLVELKDPTKPKADQCLTPDQEEFHRNWTGQVMQATNVVDIIEFMTGVPVYRKLAAGGFA
jgi:hypothetical protein